MTVLGSRGDAKNAEERTTTTATTEARRVTAVVIPPLDDARDKLRRESIEALT